MKTSGSSIFQNQSAFINPNTNFNDTNKKIDSKNSNPLGMRNAGSSNFSGKSIFGGNTASINPSSPTKTGKSIFTSQHQIQTQPIIPESNQPPVIKNVFTGLGNFSNMAIEKNTNSNSNNVFNQNGIFGKAPQVGNNNFGKGIFGNQSSVFNANNIDMDMDIDMNSTNSNYKNVYINNTLSSSNKIEEVKDIKDIKSKEVKSLEEFENVVSEMFEIPIIF